MHGITSDHVVGLSDGRSLSYAQYGDPAGVPDRQRARWTGLPTGRRVRLIRRRSVRGPVDLAGPGRSDPRPDRTNLDWATDVGELLDLLAIDRFAAMGWSLGGQYAAAVGYALWPRLTRVAIIAGALPLTEPGVFEGLLPIDRTYIRLSQRTPWLARQCFRAMAVAAASAPQLYGRLAARELGEADGAVLRDEGYDKFASMSREALRQPWAVVEEYRAMTRPWGFTPEELRVPVDVWCGRDDRLLHPDWPRQLARRISSATMHLVPGGHFLANLHYREIFDGLRRH